MTERLELRGKGGHDTLDVSAAPTTRCGMAKENAEMRVRYDSEKDNKGQTTKSDYSSEVGFDEDDGRLKVIEILQSPEEKCPKQLSGAWFRKRVAMITASDVGVILGLEKRRGLTGEKIIENKFKERERYENTMGECRDNRMAISLAMNKVPATKHGDYYESIALNHYEAITGETCHPFGLKTHDDEQFSFLGASPDGLTESGKIVEVKCPYTRKIQQKTRCLEHYSQIQTLLEVFDLEICDFVQFKPSGKGTGHSGDVSRPKMLIETVKRDRAWFENHRRELLKFSKKLPMPLL